MKQQYRPLKNLYFQFVQNTEFEGILQWQHVADAFNREGLIELIPNKVDPSFTGYIETNKMRSIPEKDFETTINNILSQYATDHCLTEIEK